VGQKFIVYGFQHTAAALDPDSIQSAFPEN
jgi:hypothetical protein